MTIQPGERRRRRELERAREAAQAAGGAGHDGVVDGVTTVDGPASPPGVPQQTTPTTSLSPAPQAPLAQVPQQASAPTTSGVQPQAPDPSFPPPGPADRPLSRRELRERERRRAATLPEQRSGSSDGGRPAADRPDATEPRAAVTEPRPDVTGPRESRTRGPHADHVDHDVEHPHGYTWKHYLALAAVAFVLGFLIWSLTTSTSDPGAPRAAAVDPTTSPSALSAAHRGEP